MPMLRSRIAKQNLWDFCNAPHFFESGHSRALIFCCDVAQRQQGGGFMHQSTWVVLLLLMAGEIAILAIGGFVLWLAGEFGDAPKWINAIRKRRRAQ
jgi:hypothetical protein